MSYGGMACGGGAAGGYVDPGFGVQPNPGMSGGAIGPVAPGTSFAASGVLVGKDANYDGMIEKNEMGFIPTGGAISGGGGYMPGPDGGDCSDCVKTVTTYKTVQVPCTRNRYKVVNYTVPKVVPYQDWQMVTKMRTITKQVPKTVYVPQPEVVPYQTTVPITKYRTVQIPKARTVCEPHQSIVNKTIPVVKVVNVCGPPAPCPPPGPEPCPPAPCM